MSDKPPALRPWEQLKIICVLVVTVIVIVVFVDYQRGKPSYADGILDAHRAIVDRAKAQGILK